MSGTLINDYSNSDSNILAVQSTLDKTFFGKIDALTLTEFDSSTVPAISAGSVVECNGAIYQFASEEAISTTDPVTSATVADGTVYVCLVPGTGTITASFTATAPTWSDSKQGWYGTGDEANYRYVARCVKASTAYTEKYIMSGYYQYIEKALINTLEIGVLNMYAYGNIELLSWTHSNGGTSEFTILKPCRCILKNTDTSAISDFAWLHPGNYKLDGSSADIVWTYQNYDGTNWSIVLSENVETSTQVFGISGSTIEGDTIKLYAVSAEGCSALTVANLITT